MNTQGLCNRFEREAILRIERGIPLDAHFDTCTDCDQARHKYEMLLAALPTAQPDASPPPGWQSRVLRAAKESEAARPAFSMAAWGKPFAWTTAAAAALLAVANFGMTHRSTQFEVQAETHAAATLPELAEEQANELPTGDDQVTDAKPLPSQAIPKAAPNRPAPIAPAAMPQAPEMKAPDVPSTKPSPVATTETSAPNTPRTRTLQVTRPDKLHGFKLSYPPAAMKAKIQGETSVQCTIRADGRNTNCRILKSLPYLDDAVLRAVEAAKSDPIRVNGKPVDHSDHIWHITIILREVKDDRTSARGLPNLNWDY